MASNNGKLKGYLTELHKVYILQCSDGTFYTGYAQCFSKRFLEHLTKTRGAKYTKRGIERLVYINFFRTKGEALKEEMRIKSLTREQKEKLIFNADNNFETSHLE